MVIYTNVKFVILLNDVMGVSYLQLQIPLPSTHTRQNIKTLSTIFGTYLLHAVTVNS